VSDRKTVVPIGDRVLSLFTILAAAALLLSGSISNVVRNEVSVRSWLEEVTDKKISRRFC
jgi:hypothetical protein